MGVEQREVEETHAELRTIFLQNGCSPLLERCVKGGKGMSKGEHVSRVMLHEMHTHTHAHAHATKE